jgi:small-conductance mechanosensitive channel
VDGRLIASAITLAAALVVGAVGTYVVRRKTDDATHRYHARKVVRYLCALGVLLALAVIWRAFAGRVGVVLGFAAAGVAFAMQEVIGALAGWFNIVSGGIFRVGDRIQMGGVQGDVIDITPLRTKILEMGTSVDRRETDSDDVPATWVRGRQYTGRFVAISNKTTFTEPVFNYSAMFGFVWEELTIPVPYDADVDLAQRILTEEAERTSSSEEARAAMAAAARRYPIPHTEVEPRVFLHATDNYLEAAARFVVPVRTARTMKSEMTSRVVSRLREAGIPIASTTGDVTVDFRDRSSGGSAA